MLASPGGSESDRDPPAAGRSESMRLLRKQGGVRERPPPGGLSFLSSHGQRLIPTGWLGMPWRVAEHHHGPCSSLRAKAGLLCDAMTNDTGS